MKQRIPVVLVWMFLLGVTTSISVFAQGATLTYGVTQGAYQEINGGDLRASGSDIGSYSSSITLPFTYTWAGTAYTTISLEAGWGRVRFGETNDIVMAWGTPLTGAVNGTLRTQTLGTSPNRIFVVQWRNATRSPQGSSQDQYNIQVRINEGGSVDVVYGAMTTTAYMQLLIGARGGSQNIFLNASYWFSSWMMPRVSETVTPSQVVAGWTPTAGTTYSFRARAAVDASVLNFTSPAGTFDPGQPVTVKARVLNRGTTALTSVRIDWSIDGAAQPSVSYDATPAIQPGETVEVQLGSYTPMAGSFNTIVASAAAPNGGDDAVPGNDAYRAYIAPRVEGLFNVIQNGAAGAFTSVSAAIRHLMNSGMKGNVRLRLFGTQYNEQIVVPGLPASDFSVTLYAAEGYTPNFTFTPSKEPGKGIVEDIDLGLYQIYVAGQHSNIIFEDLTFTLPNDALWGGTAFAKNAKGLAFHRCTLTGFDDFMNATVDAPAIHAEATALTVSNCEVSKALVGIRAINTNQAVVIDSSTFEHIGTDGLRITGSDLLLNANTIEVDSAGQTFCGIDAVGSGLISNNTIHADLRAGDGTNVTGIRALSLDDPMGEDHGIDLHNNMVSVGASQTVRGIALAPAAINEVSRVYFNTAHVMTTVTTTSSAALLVSDNVYSGMQQDRGGKDAGVQGAPPLGDFALINNIFDNAGDGGDSVVGGYAVLNTLDDAGTSDFNVLMTNGPNVGMFNGVVIARDTVGHPLASWRTATGGDANSVSLPLDFVSHNNLHLKTISTSLLGASSIIASVPKDIDGQERKAPYMGADEVVPVPTITKQPQSRYACIGEEVRFSIEVEVVSGANVTYQWYRDGSPIPGATSAILDFNFVTYALSGVYVCEVTATDNFHTVRMSSEPATLIVVRPTEIVENPLSQPTAPGTTVSLDVIADAIGSPFTFSPKYQWKKRFWDPSAQAYLDTNIVDDGRISGTRSSRLTIRDVQSTDTADVYVCEVEGYCGRVTSEEARIFFPSVLVSLNTPRPCAGDSIVIECAVLPGIVRGSEVSFQWYFEGTPLADDSRIVGSTTKVLKVRNITTQDGGRYYCKATYEGVGTSVTSDTIGVGIAGVPLIVSQPLGDTVCVGDSVRFEIKANGNDLTYQWMTGNTNIPGATSSTLELTNLRTTFSGQYSVTVRNFCGVVQSDTFNLLVIRAPRITKQPVSTAVFDGGTIRFTVETDEQEPLTYTWFRNDTLIDSATQSTYEVVASVSAKEAGSYYCIVSNICGADTSDVVKADITVTVDEDDVLAGGYTFGKPTPNPASDRIGCTYSLPTAQHVKIALTTMVGAQVTTLVDAIVEAGVYRLDAELYDLQLSPGMYMLTFQAGGVMTARQFVIVR